MTMTKPRTIVLRGILRDAEGKVLLMQRSRACKTWAGFWEFPGGKVDPGEGLDAALKREFLEEAGITIGVGELFAHFEWERDRDVISYKIFKVRGDGRGVRLSHEHDAFGWFALEELKAMKISAPLESVVKDLLLKG